ncbi:MAG: TIR domain-containing protein [Gammaproteobacteria bacterium]
MTASTIPRAVFVSYASEDAAAAEAVVGALERAGTPCWIAPRDVEPGALYADEIVGAINDCRVVVLVLSARSVASAHVGKELERASSKGRRIIALRTDATPLPRAFEYFLSESQWIEVGPQGIEQAASKLVESVQRHLGLATAKVPGVTDAAQPTPEPRRFHSFGKLWGIAAALLVVIAAAVGWNTWRATPEPQTKPPAAAARVTADPSIAVLPFVNMSSDKEQDFFADGLSEELLNQLARLPNLRVIGRTSSFAFKGRNEDLRRIGELLGVNHILEGSVRKSGNQLRVTAQLINPLDGSHLWSETYDREFANIFAIQDEISKAVAGKLQLTLGGGGKKSGGTQNVEAYEAYLVGRSKLNAAQPAEVLEAVQHLERATTLDPDFQDAWYALLLAHATAGNLNPERRASSLQRIKEISAQVLKTAPDSEAATFARVRSALAAKDFVTALALLHGQATRGTDFVSYGSLLLVLGQPVAAADAYGEARQRDPLVGILTVFKMIAHEVAGQNAKADEEYQRVLLLPNVNRALAEGSALVRAMGLRDRPSIDRLLPRVIAAGPEQSAVNGTALKYLDDAPAALRELRRLIKEPVMQQDLYSMAALSQWAAYFGDDALSLDALLRTTRSGTGVGAWGFSLWRPIIKGVRRLPGFKTLLREQGFVDYWRKSGNWGDFCKPVGADDFECR